MMNKCLKLVVEIDLSLKEAARFTGKEWSMVAVKKGKLGSGVET